MKTDRGGREREVQMEKGEGGRERDSPKLLISRYLFLACWNKT